MRLFSLSCAVIALSLTTLAQAKDTGSNDKKNLAKRIKQLEKTNLRDGEKRHDRGVVLDKDCDVPFVTGGSLTIFGIKPCTIPPTQEDLDRKEEFGGR